MIVTIHDIGTSYQSLHTFCCLPSMQQVAERSLIVHVSLPGQHPGAPDLQSDYSSMQELSEGVLAILNLLQLGQVIVLGVGAGANIGVRLCLLDPNRVLGLVAVNPLVSSPGMLDQVRARAVVADLKVKLS